MFPRALLLASLCAVLPACAHGTGPHMPGSKKTTVYLAQRIRTLDPAHPLATALAVRGDRILAVGDEAHVRDAAGSGAEVVDLGDAVIVPGLEDAHGHLASYGRSLTIAQLAGTGSVAEIVERLRHATPASFQGEWLVGRGWDQNDWPEGQRAFPSAADLDAAFPKTPVFLTRIDGHAAWVNSEALRRAGIDAHTPDPDGGRLIRDGQGRPTGVLVDNAIALVEDKLPQVTDAQLQQRLIAAMKRLAEKGITGIHDAGMDLRTFQLLQQWDLAGLLPIRIYAMGDAQGKDAQTWLERGPFQGRMLSMRAVKLFADGALGSRGAALFQPYSDDPDNSGLLLMSPQALQDKVDAFMQRGFQVCVHAIGDRANALVIDAFEHAMKKTGRFDSRPRLEHAQILRAQDVPRLHRLGIIASMQPTHATSDMPWAEARVGRDRLRFAYAWKSILDSGAALAFGSDFPVEDPDVLAGLYAARTRQDARGLPKDGWFPEQRLSGEQALQAFTTGAAFASFAEHRRGSLRPGMDADFTVLSVDPVDAPPPELLKGRVIQTVVGGVGVLPPAY